MRGIRTMTEDEVPAVPAMRGTAVAGARVVATGDEDTRLPRRVREAG
jgi:hypothetical protein